MSISPGPEALDDCAQGATTSSFTDSGLLLQDVNLRNGWRVTQDVRELGEKAHWYEPDFVADWQSIERLAHLQLLLAPQPYFGRDLRYFNSSPWWYRLEFASPRLRSQVTLRFEGVDYYAKVWLNGVLLGEHEGYADPFEFEVGSLLFDGRQNVLVVKVSSPWDHEYLVPTRPVWSVIRNLIKGSYEHADTFVQRDVNPVGIWRPVKLILHGELREADRAALTTSVSSDQQEATVKVSWSVFNDGAPTDSKFAINLLCADTEDLVATSCHCHRLEHGLTTLESTTLMPRPKLWTTWDRGAQPLYRAELNIELPDGARLSSSIVFGVRTVELIRSADETRFFLNGKPIYLRGTTYWGDLYLSNMSRARYERDLRASIRAGVNALRVHVHTENFAFYDLCDRLGIIVIQDSDLNWVFPVTPQFNSRAVQHFGSMVRQLRNHSSVIAWIAMNEIYWGTKENTRMLRMSDAKALGAQMIAEALRRDPTRPVIENSGVSNDLDSGDTHEYRGSLMAGTYFDISASPEDEFGSAPKFVTEFGVDAPPAASSANRVPLVAQRLTDVLPRVAELHNYQYRLLKYYMEYYRIHKYAPNAGYFQFMWIDFSPQSFYGIYDYWGDAKTEGLGGGLKAMEESNQPIGVFLEHDTQPRALHAVNDTLVDLGTCTVRWRVTTSDGKVVEEDSQPVCLGPDSHRHVRDFCFPVQQGETYKAVLELSSRDGRLLAKNSYVNPFQLQSLPRGYPDRKDEELGIRLWWADQN